MSASMSEDQQTPADWMMEAIRDLPQAGQIREDDFAAWAEAVQAMDDFHPLSWHIQRLRGIGGSEAGVAVAQAEVDDGVMPDSSRHTPTGLVRDKLVQRLPHPPEAAMLRGNRVEELAIERFLEQTGATRRVDLEQKVGQFSGAVPDHPWMVGNPDLVAEMPDGSVILADIKAPNEPSRTAEPEYVAQLHHYRRIMATAGVTPDQMMLAKFDYKHFNVITVPVDFDADLETKLLRGGDSLWQHVLDGREPDMSHCETPEPDWARLDDTSRVQVEQTVRDAEERLVLEKLAAKAINDDITTQTERIREALGELGPLRGCKAPDVGLTLAGFRNAISIDEAAFTEAMRNAGADAASIDAAYKTTSQYDTDAMARRLAELGENPEAYRKRSLDTTKAIKALEAAGIDYNRAFGEIAVETPSFAISKPKKGEPAEIFEAMERYVEQTVPNMRAALFDPMDKEAPAEVADDASKAEPTAVEVAAAEPDGEPAKQVPANSLFDQVMNDAGMGDASRTHDAGDANAPVVDPDPVGDPAPAPTGDSTPRRPTKDPLDSLFPG